MPFPLLAALPAIIGAAGSVGSSVAGGAMSAADRASKMRLLEQAMKEYNIDLPTLERITGEQLGPSAMEGVAGQMDPRLKTDQMSALGKLGEYSETGDTAESKAVMHRILGDVARQEGAGRNAILGNMRARGVSGSGAELAMQLENQQASADRAQTAGLDQAAGSQKRMLDAVLAKGNLAGSIRRQDYGEASDAAQARDKINAYNSGERSRAKYYNAGLNQQQFGNSMARATGKANAANGVATAYGQQADRTAAIGAGVGKGIGQIGATVSSELLKDDEKKGGY